MRAGSVTVLFFFLAQIFLTSFASTASASEATEAPSHSRAAHLAFLLQSDDEPDDKAGADLYRTCYADGFDRAGLSFSAGGWFAGGLACGFLLGLIGTLIIWASAGGDVTVDPGHYRDLSGDCLQGYLDGYQSKAKSKKKGAALGGGLLGTAILVVLVLASQ